MKLFDTHTHLLDEQFQEDRNQLLPAIAQGDVKWMLEACCEIDDMPKICALITLYDHVYGSVGVHPHFAKTLTPSVLERMAQVLDRFKKLVAVGEIGLDYHYDYAPREVQRRAFADQIAVAKAAKRPIIVHDREAHGDTMEIIRANRYGLSGVLHCYSGSYEDAVKYIDMGLYIAFGGALTFKNATKQQDIAARLPLDRLVVETDCPYMTPEPHRGERNDPRLMHLTVEKLAEVRGMEPEALAERLTRNAKSLFGIADA